jgi:hypothetical protein
MGKQAYYAWTNHALGASLMAETILARAKGTHPLSINRIHNALELSRGVGKIAKEVNSKEHLFRHGKANINIQEEHGVIREKGGIPVFENFSRDDLFSVLEGLRGLFIDARVDIEPFMNSTSIGWRSLFE